MSELTTFNVLFTQLLEANKINLPAFTRRLAEEGNPISYNTLITYKSFKVVPNYKVAKLILSSLGYEISEDELTSILTLSSDVLKDAKQENRKYIERGLRIKTKIFNPLFGYSEDDSVSAEELNVMIEQRLQEVAASSDFKRIIKNSDENPNMNAYIEYLIYKDLEGNGYANN